MNFSQAELRTIVEQASSISERLTTNFIPNNLQKNNALANSNLEKWCQLIALGNWEKFQQRLAWDGLDISTAKSILGFVKMNKDVPLPSWTTTLNECLAASSAFELDVIKNNPCLNPKKPLPFEEIWLPFIHIAHKKLIDKVDSKQQLLSNEVYTSLERSLLEWLTHLSSLTLELEFSAFRATKQSTLQRFLQVSNQTSSKQNYQLFVKEILTKKLYSFLKNYPVLARLVSISINMWIKNISEFIIRLKSDFLDIKKVFSVQQELGQVVAIQTNLSDRHDNGNSVMTVTFSSKSKFLGL
jgi:lantibiotic modifying enzyme